MIRHLVQVLSILNLVVFALCAVLGLTISPNAEAVQTWEYLLLIPLFVTLALMVLQFSSSVRNDLRTLLLLLVATLPFFFLMVPALLIHRKTNDKNQENPPSTKNDRR